MFLLGIILIIVGFAVALLWPHPQANALGGLLIIIGLVLVVVSLVDIHDAHGAFLVPFLSGRRAVRRLGALSVRGPLEDR